MSLTLEIDDTFEQVFEFETFEIVLSKNGNYLLCDAGFFPIEGLESFKLISEQYIILNTDGDTFFISEEEFEKIKEIYIKHM